MRFQSALRGSASTVTSRGLEHGIPFLERAQTVEKAHRICRIWLGAYGVRRQKAPDVLSGRLATPLSISAERGGQRLRHLCNHLPLVQLFQPISRDPVFTLVSPGNLSIDGTGGVGIIPEVDRQQGSQWS
jgi:hypothetical protein